VRQVLSLPFAALAWACASPASPCGTSPAPVDLVGSWHYEGTQSSPTTATLIGTLTITSQSGQDFYGTLDVTETDGSGPRQLSGVVTGCAVDATSVDFDAFLAGARRHLGTVTVGADSIKGTWVESGMGGPPSASGSFESARSGP
jgi:hypothetical protein